MKFEIKHSEYSVIFNGIFVGTGIFHVLTVHLAVSLGSLFGGIFGVRQYNGAFDGVSVGFFIIWSELCFNVNRRFHLYIKLAVRPLFLHKEMNAKGLALIFHGTDYSSSPWPR